MRIPLIRGRFFDGRDRENAVRVAIINRKAAQDFWPNQNPIGKRLKLGTADSANAWMQVVGVTADVKRTGLTDAPLEEIDCPYLQAGAIPQWQRFLAVRTSGDPLSIVRELRRIAAELDPDEPLNHVMLMSDIVQAETRESRTQTTLLGIFAALALIMATVGIYGVMAYLVTQRTQEIGVRMALGARKNQILGMVLKRGMRLSFIGTGSGAAAALILTRLIRTLLFGVSATDIGILASVTVLIILASVFACLIPARRAASIHPVEALRAE